VRLTTGRLEIDWTPGREHFVVMHGQLDERADLESFAKQLADAVVLDLERITFINSIGVREWIRMLRALEMRKVRVVLRRCSEALVLQMNMILEMQTGTTVESFFAPYLCEDCGHESSRCLDVREHAAGLRRMQLPPQPCGECGSMMQFSEIPARYLLFLANHPTGRSALLASGESAR
jgi:anti-anti-sigma regulatory factor